MKNAIVEHFEQAVRNHEMRGTFDVQDRPLIEAEYLAAKANLVRIIEDAINLRPAATYVVVNNSEEFSIGTKPKA